jgi:hypothetical protein
MEKEGKRTVGYFTRLLFKFYLKLKDKFDQTPKITDEEKYCVQICLKLLENSSSKLTFAPVSSTRFIVNEDKQMFVVINNHTINITNHVYSYTVYVQESSSYTKVVKRFDTLLEEERQNIQEEIRRNIKHSLQCILNSLN